MKNIAIYWGSFNPPTLAHSMIVEQVLIKTDVEKIIISPSWIRGDKSFWVNENHRENLIDIFFEALKDKWLNIEFDDHFLKWKNWWHTTTIQEESYFKNKLWFSPLFIYWSDVVSQMPAWYWNEDKFIEKRLQKIFINRPWYSFEPEKYFIDNFILLNIHNMLNISSSMAKEMIQNKQNITWILSPEIEKYIKENNLYF
jgi:nicotinate-nucleotide adenylyltransferase